MILNQNRINKISICVGLKWIIDIVSTLPDLYQCVKGDFSKYLALM